MNCLTQCIGDKRPRTDRKIVAVETSGAPDGGENYELSLTWNPAESLVYGVLSQLNVLHQAASCFSRYDIWNIAIHVYLCNVLLIRLLRIRRQPTTGFALVGAHQAQSPGFRQPYVLLETKLHEISEYTLICKLTKEKKQISLQMSFALVIDSCILVHSGARWPNWLEREFTDRKVRGSSPTSASRLPLSRLGQTGSIPALVLPSGCMTVRHRKSVTVGPTLTTELNSATKPLCTGGAENLERERETKSRMDFGQSEKNRSAMALFRCLVAMLPEGSTRAGILPGCLSLDRESREAEVECEPRTFRSNSTGRSAAALQTRPGLSAYRDLPHFLLSRITGLQKPFQLFEKYTHMQINSAFARDSTKSLVYDILQLNAMHTGRLMIQLARYSRYRSTFS
ncbi:LOW QUALITY PROTEIN: hypothetical protein T265_14741 [Opisthorchis viverrini]|uniref:Uncharacterized protein n=1 Tax=Opisthorchis viverrini TaxID=6198 RepID=A0A074Z700_OPIVI|nr:LOW QUALITY PROTEIN: hypothetical protein T265_14741 [Opisthorchis viverrini]KER22966.1 LOW QUALITY PROTEIN: hypothetical protein T265_14741 [Opisthorchis viverrini]